MFLKIRENICFDLFSLAKSAPSILISKNMLYFHTVFGSCKRTELLVISSTRLVIELNLSSHSNFRPM